LASLNPPRQGFLDALRALSRALDDCGAPAMIIGGVSLIALGVPRLTSTSMPLLQHRQSIRPISSSCWDGTTLWRIPEAEHGSGDVALHRIGS
jgi:hypothetical protein